MPGTYRKQEKAIFLSLVMDILLLVPEIVAAVLSGSVTLFADSLKCGNEAFATLLAWITLRRVAEGGGGTYDYGLTAPLAP